MPASSYGHQWFHSDGSARGHRTAGEPVARDRRGPARGRRSRGRRRRPSPRSPGACGTSCPARRRARSRGRPARRAARRCASSSRRTASCQLPDHATHTASSAPRASSSANGWQARGRAAGQRDELRPSRRGRRAPAPTPRPSRSSSGAAAPVPRGTASGSTSECGGPSTVAPPGPARTSSQCSATGSPGARTRARRRQRPSPRTASAADASAGHLPIPASAPALEVAGEDRHREHRRHRGHEQAGHQQRLVGRRSGPASARPSA